MNPRGSYKFLLSWLIDNNKGWRWQAGNISPYSFKHKIETARLHTCRLYTAYLQTSIQYRGFYYSSRSCWVWGIMACLSTCGPSIRFVVAYRSIPALAVNLSKEQYQRNPSVRQQSKTFSLMIPFSIFFHFKRRKWREIILPISATFNYFVTRPFQAIVSTPCITGDSTSGVFFGTLFYFVLKIRWHCGSTLCPWWIFLLYFAMNFSN